MKINIELVFVRFLAKIVGNYICTAFNMPSGPWIPPHRRFCTLFRRVLGVTSSMVLLGYSGFVSADPTSPTDSSGANNHYWCSGSDPNSGQAKPETAIATLCIVSLFSPGAEIVGTPSCSGSWIGPYAPGDDEDRCSGQIRFWVGDYGGVPAHWEYRVGSSSVSRCSMFPEYTKWNGSSCVSVVPKKVDGCGCEQPWGDPIFPSTGTTKQTVALPFSVGGTALKLVYDQRIWAPVQQNLAFRSQAKPMAFGTLWQLNLFKSIVPYRLAAIPGGVAALELQRGSNEWRNYQANATGTLFTSADDLLDVIQPQGQGWLRVDGTSGNEEVYDASGALTAIYSNHGGFISNSVQSSGFQLVDNFGRAIQFAAGSNGLIESITGPDGYVAQISYDSTKNLNKVIWSDTGFFAHLNYADNHVWALTGVVDENHSQIGDGIQFASFDYDADGRAVGTQLAGGVDHYSVAYSQAPFRSVSDLYDPAVNAIWETTKWISPVSPSINLPNGQVATISFIDLNGAPAQSGQTQSPGSGSSAATNAATYDSATSAIASYDDFDGNRTCYGIDPVRGLRLEVLDGLPGGASGKTCPANLASYVPNPADAAHPERKTTTVWHPVWALKTREAEPKKLTTWVYNGQPDPIVGGTASCAATAPALPDGKPIAVLCARYEQATTDATGGLGLSATISGATRAWTYTYNQYGQVLSETSPKQSPADGLSHTTTYVYYPTTSFAGSVGHTMGDLNTITNPLAQVTTYLTYDKAGRLLSMRDANSTVTSMTYWPRGWLHTQSVTPASGAALTTTYDYWPTGLLKTVTMPDATTLNYAYDDAHRLTDVVDGAGNKIHYVLDNLGNHTSEQVSDPSGRLASTVTRVFDDLNRVQSTTGVLH